MLVSCCCFQTVLRCHTVLSRKTISGDKVKIIPINLSKLLDKKEVIQDKSTSTISMFFSANKGRHFFLFQRKTLLCSHHTGFSMGCFCSQIPKHKAVHSLKINQQGVNSIEQCPLLYNLGERGPYLYTYCWPFKSNNSFKKLLY